LRLDWYISNAYTVRKMRVDWDPEKARIHRRKHGVALPDAEVALFDPHALTREDESAEAERRFVTLGIDALGRFLVLVFSLSGDVLRLILAGKATRRERSTYEAGV
jgi:uncharacterized DUF497 family protein